MRLWDKLFRPGPECLGITELGQIVIRQFIKGWRPEQKAVDDFLEKANLAPMDHECGIISKEATNQRSHRLDKNLLSWFPTCPSLAGESAFTVPWSSG